METQRYEKIGSRTTIPRLCAMILAVGIAFAPTLRCIAGSVVGWGYSGAGETVVPANATNVVAIAGGGGHSLALRADGTVVAWGNNYFGQSTVPGVKQRRGDCWGRRP